MRGGYRYFTSVENEVIRATTRQDVWLVSQNIDTVVLMWH